MITLDVNKPYGTITGETPNGARFVQDGIEFGADKKVLGDAAKILKERNELALAEKKQELETLLASAAQLESDLGGKEEPKEAPKEEPKAEDKAPEATEAPKSKPPKSKPSKA